MTEVNISATLPASYKLRAVTELDSISHRADVMSGKFPFVVVFSWKFLLVRRKKNLHQEPSSNDTRSSSEWSKVSIV